MGMKSIIALFMGLVIQISQAQLCLAAAAVNAVSSPSHSMSCCAGAESCPCAKQSDPAQKPSPLIPVVPELKWLVSRVLEASGLAARIVPPSDPVRVGVSKSKALGGFTGVPLAVAFCCFVI